jgi:hypothetical protein
MLAGWERPAGFRFSIPAHRLASSEPIREECNIVPHPPARPWLVEKEGQYAPRSSQIT